MIKIRRRAVGKDDEAGVVTGVDGSRLRREGDADGGGFNERGCSADDVAAARAGDNGAVAAGIGAAHTGNSKAGGTGTGDITTVAQITPVFLPLIRERWSAGCADGEDSGIAIERVLRCGLGGNERIIDGQHCIGTGEGAVDVADDDGVAGDIGAGNRVDR